MKVLKIQLSFVNSFSVIKSIIFNSILSEVSGSVRKKVGTYLHLPAQLLLTRNSVGVSMVILLFFFTFDISPLFVCHLLHFQDIRLLTFQGKWHTFLQILPIWCRQTCQQKVLYNLHRESIDNKISIDINLHAWKYIRMKMYSVSFKSSGIQSLPYPFLLLLHHHNSSSPVSSLWYPNEIMLQEMNIHNSHLPISLPPSLPLLFIKFY